MKIFNETKRNMTLTQKFDYIKTHFTYWTLNSWNGLESIANKVKVYNLKLTSGQIDKFFEILSNEQPCFDCVSQNRWGTTTGKHLNWIDGGDKKSRLNKEEFDKQLQEFLK